VKVTLSLSVPGAGAVAGVVHANVHAVEAVPPVSVDDASVWPYVIPPAAGHAVTDGVAALTVTLTDPGTVA
jgi:hypothetical protein